MPRAERHTVECSAYAIPAGDADRPCTCALWHRQKIFDLETDLHEVKVGYHQLDTNWEIIHNAAMTPIRTALGDLEATVPEIVAQIVRLKSALEFACDQAARIPEMAQEFRLQRQADEARIQHLSEAAEILRASGECPPAMAQLNEENYQRWQAWRAAD